MFAKRLVFNIENQLVEINQSHPSWMRGLKQRLLATHNLVSGVASFVDAWIETFLTSYVLVNKMIFKLLSLFLLRCYVSL